MHWLFTHLVVVEAAYSKRQLIRCCAPRDIGSVKSAVLRLLIQSAAISTNRFDYPTPRVRVIIMDDHWPSSITKQLHNVRLYAHKIRLYAYKISQLARKEC